MSAQRSAPVASDSKIGTDARAALSQKRKRRKKEEEERDSPVSIAAEGKEEKRVPPPTVLLLPTTTPYFISRLSPSGWKERIGGILLKVSSILEILSPILKTLLADAWGYYLLLERYCLYNFGRHLEENST